MSQWPIIAGPSYGVGLSAITSSRHIAIKANAAAQIYVASTLSREDLSRSDRHQK